jgi:hypothetical protein
VGAVVGHVLLVGEDSEPSSGGVAVVAVDVGSVEFSHATLLEEEASEGDPLLVQLVMARIPQVTEVLQSGVSWDKSLRAAIGAVAGAGARGRFLCVGHFVFSCVATKDPAGMSTYCPGCFSFLWPSSFSAQASAGWRGDFLNTFCVGCEVRGVPEGGHIYRWVYRGQTEYVGKSHGPPATRKLWHYHAGFTYRYIYLDRLCQERVLNPANDRPLYRKMRESVEEGASFWEDWTFEVLQWIPAEHDALLGAYEMAWCYALAPPGSYLPPCNGTTFPVKFRTPRATRMYRFKVVGGAVELQLDCSVNWPSPTSEPSLPAEEHKALYHVTREGETEEDETEGVCPVHLPDLRQVRNEPATLEEAVELALSDRGKSRCVCGGWEHNEEGCGLLEMYFSDFYPEPGHKMFLRNHVRLTPCVVCQGSDHCLLSPCPRLAAEEPGVLLLLSQREKREKQERAHRDRQRKQNAQTL